MAQNRVWRLRKRPEGELKDGVLELCTEPVPTPDAHKNFLVKNLFISIDPTHRIWMSSKAQYMHPARYSQLPRAAHTHVCMAATPAPPRGAQPGEHPTLFPYFRRPLHSRLT